MHNTRPAHGLLRLRREVPGNGTGQGRSVTSLASCFSHSPRSVLNSFMFSKKRTGAVTENVDLCDAVAQINERLSRAHSFRGIVERNLLSIQNVTNAGRQRNKEHLWLYDEVSIKIKAYKESFDYSIL